MCKLSTQLCHLVHFIHTLALQEVETVQVLVIMGEEQLVLGLLHAHDCLEDSALTLLNPLTHRVEIGAEVNGCREDTLEILTL